MTKKAGRIFDRILGAFAFVAGILIVFTMLGVTAQVIVRKAFPRGGLTWMMEISEYCLLWVTFLGIAWVLQKEGHVIIDTIVGRFNEKRRALITATTSIVGAILSALITWYSMRVIWECFQGGFTTAKVLDPPIYIILSIIPVGMLLLVIQFIRRARKNFKIWKNQ